MLPLLGITRGSSPNQIVGHDQCAAGGGKDALGGSTTGPLTHAGGSTLGGTTSQAAVLGGQGGVTATLPTSAGGSTGTGGLTSTGGSTSAGGSSSTGGSVTGGTSTVAASGASASDGSAGVTVNLGQTKQEMAGSGINNNWAPGMSDAEADALFNTTGNGIGLSILRIGMGSNGAHFNSASPAGYDLWPLPLQ